MQKLPVEPVSARDHILLYDFEDPCYLPLLEQLHARGFPLVLNCAALAALARERGIPVLEWADFIPETSGAFAGQETGRMFGAIARSIERLSLASAFDTAFGNVIVESGEEFFARLYHIFVEAIETIATLSAVQAAAPLGLVCVASERLSRQRALVRMAKARGIPTLLVDHFHHVCDQGPETSRKLLSRHIATFSEATASYFHDLGAPQSNIESIAAPYAGEFLPAKNGAATGWLKQRLQVGANDRLILVLGGSFEFKVSDFQKRLSSLCAFNQRLLPLAAAEGQSLALVLHPDEIASEVQMNGQVGKLAARYKAWAATRGVSNVHVLESVTAAESREADLLVSFGAAPRMMPALLSGRPVLVFDWNESGLPHIPHTPNVKIVTAAAALPAAAQQLIDGSRPNAEIATAGPDAAEREGTERLAGLMARLMEAPPPPPATDSEQTGIVNETLNMIYATIARNG